MSDRDYTAPLPSWGQFFMFILIFFMGIFSISMSAVSFLGYTSENSYKYIFTVPQLFVFCFFVLCYLMVHGWSSARGVLVFFNTLIAIGSLVKIFFDKNNEFLFLQIGISVVSSLACLLLMSSYFKEFVAYRRRHIAVVKKARRGELLDDGEPFYREKIKDS
ncbi:hypothetical protein MSP8887_01669 [Marinomonas spartinae]|uniref:hypothetical protein n=1 Tax=Marinomonas spartinae TaxID=1792290 RepID=UPI00080905E3|nr:hypothetical protein [Marinomonas spartinae]SBS32202.1 hypothetical protein MSP8887_01669 [Marinomonas spartinae]